MKAKRIVSILLTGSMLLSLLPVSALAAAPVFDAPAQTTAKKAAPLVQEADASRSTEEEAATRSSRDLDAENGTAESITIQLDAKGKPTNEVDYDHWFYDAVSTALFLTDGTFQPGGGLTRAEAATIFHRLLLDTSLTKSVSFSDVKAGSWYESAVKVLASKGVIGGYPDGLFKPNASVTRAEFCAMASRFFALEEGTVKFTDVPTTFWGYPYIASVVAKGWLSDSATAYQPNGAISRAEVVSIVNKMLGRSADEAFLSKGADGLKAFTDVKAGDSCYLDVMEAANAHNYKRSGGKEAWTGLQ